MISEKNKILYVAPPYIVRWDKDLPGSCSNYPIESDTPVLFKKALIASGHLIEEPRWYIENNILKCDFNRIDFESISIILAEVNFPFVDYDLPFKNFNNPIITYIPDCFPKDNDLDIVERVAQYSKVIVAMSPGYKDYLFAVGRPDLASKFVETFCPTDFRVVDFADKIYDISYIGLNKIDRAELIKKIIDIKNINLFINTAGKVNSINNRFSKMEDYFNVLASSKFTLATPAVPQIHFKLKDSAMGMTFPEVLPGRVYHAISVCTIPIYYRSDLLDKGYPEFSEPNFPIVLVEKNDNASSILDKMQDKLKTYDLDNFKSYHNNLYSTKAVLNKIFTKLNEIN
jgi:hypothetical protein